MTHLPRVTGEVRSGLEVVARNAPLPSRPLRDFHVRAERDAPELAAVDVRDAVVLGQPLVDERVVGRQQVDDAAILADDAVEQQLDFAAHRLAQRIVEVRDRAAAAATSRRGRAGSATGPAKLTASASAFGSFSMRRTCCSSTAGSFSRPARGELQQLRVGAGLHRKNDSRDARSTSLMR